MNYLNTNTRTLQIRSAVASLAITAAITASIILGMTGMQPGAGVPVAAVTVQSSGSAA